MHESSKRSDRPIGHPFLITRKRAPQIELPPGAVFPSGAAALTGARLALEEAFSGAAPSQTPVHRSFDDVQHGDVAAPVVVVKRKRPFSVPGDTADGARQASDFAAPAAPENERESAHRSPRVFRVDQTPETIVAAERSTLEDGLGAMGVAVWPMVELEADDALAAAARIACEDERVDKVLIWTPDKDIAQCVRDDRVVQVDRKAKTIRDAEGVRRKFGVAPHLIPDFLALVGDAADGYPGIAGIGAVTAAQLLNRHGPIEAFPESVLRGQRATALLFKRLATLSSDAPLFADVEALRWLGPTEAFAS